MSNVFRVVEVLGPHRYRVLVQSGQIFFHPSATLWRISASVGSRNLHANLVSMETLTSKDKGSIAGPGAECAISLAPDSDEPIVELAVDDLIEVDLA